MEILSWIIVCLSFLSAYLVAKHRIGWIVGMIAQSLWVIYGISTEQYALTMQGLVFITIFIRNFRVSHNSL